MVLEEQLMAFRSMRAYFDAKKADLESPSPSSPLDDLIRSLDVDEEEIGMPRGPYATAVLDEMP